MIYQAKLVLISGEAVIIWRCFGEKMVRLLERKEEFNQTSNMERQSVSLAVFGVERGRQ